MRIVRAIVVALTAFSVAFLPLAGIGAQAHSPGTSIGMPSDCCPQGQHCDKQAKGDCAKFAECLLKCSSVSGIPVTPAGLVFSPTTSLEAPSTTGLATALLFNPPSPPPRV
jgi:hypothetical protein